MVNFFFEDTPDLKLDKQFFLSWLSELCVNEGSTLDELSLIFCTDEYLLGINKKYLNHNYYTDIITFNYTIDGIKGDLFISTERVSENSEKQGVSFSKELNRVIAHGTLHLLGYSDNNAENKAKMTEKEDAALKLFVSRET